MAERNKPVLWPRKKRQKGDKCPEEQVEQYLQQNGRFKVLHGLAS
jgi:hypothetical protein